MSSIGRAPAPEIAPETPEQGAPLTSRITDPAEESINLLPYLRLLWESRRFLMRAALSAFLASALFAMLIPNRYFSITRLMPPDGQSSGIGLGILAAVSGKSSTSTNALGGIASDLLGVKSSGALFVGIIGSQAVQDRLIEEFNLRKGFFGTSRIEDARQNLLEHTDVSEDRKSGIITIGVTDHDPKRAAALAQSYVNELDRVVALVSTSSARRERIFLEERLKTVKSDLDTAARNFSVFASKNSAIDIPAQGKAMVEAAATLQGRLIAAQAELSGLQQIYTSNNVRVRSAEARVNELQKKLNEIGGGDVTSNANQPNALYPSIRRLPILGVTYADLFRQTKIEETVFELLTQQYELAKVQEAKEIPSVKVLDVAMVPTKKSFPPRGTITIIGTLLGLAVAMTWILAKKRWDAAEASDPGKVFATEMYTTMRASLPSFSRNGAAAEPRGGRRWSRRKKRLNEPERKQHEDEEDGAK